MTPDGTTNSMTGGGSAGSPGLTAPRGNAALSRQNTDAHPVDTEFHSLLLLSPEKRLYQLPVDPSSGDYLKEVREIREREEGYRKVVNIAGEGSAHSPQTSRVSLALLPIKDEPNSGFICCYLANANQLDLHANAAQAWQDRGPNESKPTGEPEPVVSLLVAGTSPDGRLNRILIDDATRRVDGQEYEAARALLARGCVAGEVETERGLVPLINLATLKPARTELAPALATVNPLGRVFAVGVPAAENGAAHRPAQLNGGRVLSLAERNAAQRLPRARGEQLARRNATQAANIAVAILPAGEAAIPLDGDAGVASNQSPVILFNALRLNVKNVWTVAEWSDQDQINPLTNEPPPNLPFRAELPAQGSTRLFVAVAPGEIYDVDLARAPAVERDFLANNSEVWRLLRNGCLAGAVTAGGESYQLVNLAAFGGQLESAMLEPRAVLASTWDFKWPAGKRLRVRFAPLQEPDRYAPAVLRALKKKVQRLVQSWVYDADGNRLANLELRDEDFDDLRDGEELDDYDILIDLSDLPAVVPGGESRPARPVKLPFSEIGSYASRMPYGVPTLWLGFPDGIRGEDQLVVSRTTTVVKKAGRDELDGYFGSPAFEHIVLHEFGHALGLPHLHQSPDLRDPFVSQAKARQDIATHLGVVMSEEEVLEELKLRWSGPGAGERTDWFDVIGQYADYRQQRDGIPRQTLISELEAERRASSEGPRERELVGWLAQNSVMMGLPVRVIYKSQPLSAVDYQTTLGDIDKRWIKQLYPLPQT